MKLLARYNRVTLVTTVIMMLITGIIYYFTISLILTDDIDKDLEVEENEIFEYVAKNNQLPQVFESNDQQISFSEATQGAIKRYYIDTVYKKSEVHRRHRRRHEEYESGRALISSVSAGGKYYRVAIVKSTVETEDLLKIIFGITIGVILLLLLALFTANRLLLNRLWQPFHNLLKELRSFSISDNKTIPEPDTNIDEFKELNHAVAAMSSKVKKDYKELKTFTENASHELLTPIAVINSKLDSLLQTENFSQQQSKLLNDLYTSVSRLTRLNQSLLLLVKIENRLVDGDEEIDLKPIVEELLAQFEEIFNDKGLKVTFTGVDKTLKANRYLIDVLLNNLLSNAIRHNITGGQIVVTLTADSLVIRNTGDDTPLQSDELFKRFHKSSSSEGSGLGLTIAQQICENLGFGLNYQFVNGLHTFTAKF
ncbi:HAMP domain-containing sensor histidine kinase [Mucilaginibacter sp.]|jgi:signal transduction histidine kinase|uniref:sensor histidine kinase n=1 Tax=Mucilaginibacter sp. TaxID=1882438 RepID=UPI002B52FE9E|nr:HAMP domain-containing sensor histidine kinase [Mucilaginibacter sp.]HTI58307.1 HAMP domain-containing sensor histidine kinase [Mucilaginibacter sp.]